jgi:serine phosphatase RsbU (regulator of sigma subunit)
MATLKLLQGPANWKEYHLDRPVTRLGRPSPDAQNEVPFDDMSVSRRHAKILQQDGAWYIVDRDSRAGTYVNGQRLAPGQSQRLESGTLVRICKFVLLFVDGLQEEDSNPSSIEISQDGQSTEFSAIMDGSSSSIRRRAKENAEVKLAAIIELSQQLRNTRSLEDLLNGVLKCLLEVFPAAARGVIVLPVTPRQPRRIGVVRYRDAAAESQAVLMAPVLEEVARRNVTALLEDKRTMCASLVGRDDVSLGVIQLNNKPESGHFSNGDLDLLATLAAEIAFAVDNWILQEVAIRESEYRMELKLATIVQIALLPKSPPEIAGYRFYDYYSPARQVGGDYFDYIQLDEQRLAVVLGDVAGKGVPAAILMAKASSEISALLACGLAPLDVMNRVNTRFTDRSPEGRFVTMVLAAIDLNTHTVTMVNAGHMLPLLRRADGSIVEIGRGHSGLPLGILPEFRYQETRVVLGVGQTLLLFSDGATDASNAAGKMFGMKRLWSALTTARGDAMEIGKAIMQKIHDHVRDEPQTDDICLLCISRHA